MSIKRVGERSDRNMAEIPRMRTIKQCAAYFKAEDPESGLGEWRIRQMVKQGEIPVYRAGRRILINLDILITYVSGEGPAAEEKEKALN